MKPSLHDASARQHSGEPSSGLDPVDIRNDGLRSPANRSQRAIILSRCRLTLGVVVEGLFSAHTTIFGRLGSLNWTIDPKGLKRLCEVLD